MSEADGNSGELRDIAYHVECLVAVMERIENKLAPQGSEREQIAFMLYAGGNTSAETTFHEADHWIAERDKQRAEQAKHEQGGQTSEQA